MVNHLLPSDWSAMAGAEADLAAVIRPGRPKQLAHGFEEIGDGLIVPLQLALQLFACVCAGGLRTRDKYRARSSGQRCASCMATPCSVKTRGVVRRPPCPLFDIPDWNIKFPTSSRVRIKEKSSGNRSRLRLTALLRLKVVTP